MHKITIENKVIEATENLSVDEIIKNNFSNIRPVAAKIDGVLVDLSEIVTKDVSIELIKPADEEGLEALKKPAKRRAFTLYQAGLKDGDELSYSKDENINRL